jgi:hypothetical protein
MDELPNGIAALATIFAVYKIIADVFLARAVKHRDEYQFTKDFLSDLDQATSHRYVLEKGFRALTGDIYRVEEIRFLLSLDEPSKAIILRSSTKNTLYFNVEQSTYQWKNIYSSACFRWFAKKLFLALYILTSAVALSPFLTSQTAELFRFNPFTSFSFATIAIFSVIKHTDFIDSIQFMKLVNLE